MHGLLIAEKPSVKRAVEAVYKKEAGKLPFTLDFAAFHGHLMQLLEPADYNPAWSDWSNLPVIPDAFRYKADDVKSVNELTAKIKQGNYDFVVNACDAGREGEHIFWSFYETQGFKLPVKRFWVSSVTAPALKKALSDLRDYKDYEGLRQSAAYRAQLDWLVGMNFTRAATNRKGETTSIGRVQTPVLKLIVDRELQIRNFKPEDFYEVKGVFKVNGVDFAATHMIAPDYKETRFKKKEDADAIEAATKSKAPGTVAGTKNETKSVPAPTLYSLTELQKAANRMLKFKPDKTLSIAQKLYEDGLLTYPRTESRFLPTDMIPEIPAHISPLTSVPELAAVASGIGQAEIDRMLKGKYVDDAGITDHHAIIPTDQTPNWASLSKDEQAVYSLVGKAFLAIFLPPYQSTVSTILVNVGGHLFKAKGNVEIDPAGMKDPGHFCQCPGRPHTVDFGKRLAIAACIEIHVKMFRQTVQSPFSFQGGQLNADILMCGKIAIRIPVSVNTSVKIRIGVGNLPDHTFGKRVCDKIVAVYFKLCIHQTVYEPLCVRR